MAERAECPKLFALVIARNELDIDSDRRYITTVKSETRVGIGPTFGELARVACGLRSIDADPINLLNGPTGVNVSAKQYLDASFAK